MVRTCNFAVCEQVEGQEHLRSSCPRIESKWRISNGSSSPALHTSRLVCLRGPLQPSERCLFLAFAHNIGAASIIMSRTLSCRETFHRVDCPVTSGNLTSWSRIWSLKYGGIIRLKRLSEFFVSDCELLVTKSQWVPPEYLYQLTSNSRSYLRLMPAYRISLGFSR